MQVLKKQKCQLLISSQCIPMNTVSKTNHKENDKVLDTK